MDDPADSGDEYEGDDAVDEGGGGGVDKRHARCDERGGSGGLDGADPSRTQPFGVRGFLIKKGLRLVSSILRNGKVGEVVEAARKRGFIDDDMARAITRSQTKLLMPSTLRCTRLANSRRTSRRNYVSTLNQS